MGNTENGWRAVVALIRQDDELSRGLGVHLIVLFMAGLVLVGAGVLVITLDISGGTFTREPQITLDGPYYVGALSNLGALVWMVGVVLAVVGWTMSSEPVERRMFLAGAAVGLVLLIDDFFLVHDWVLTQSQLLDQGLIFSYLLAVVALVLIFWRTMGALAVVGVLATLGLLVGSAALDFFFNDLDQLLEDGMKFLGICTWATVWVLRSRPWQFRPSPS